VGDTSPFEDGQPHITEMQLHFFVKSVFIQCSSSGHGNVRHFLASVLIYLIISPASPPPLCCCRCSHDPYGKPYKGTDLCEK